MKTIANISIVCLLLLLGRPGGAQNVSENTKFDLDAFLKQQQSGEAKHESAQAKGLYTVTLSDTEKQAIAQDIKSLHPEIKNPSTVKTANYFRFEASFKGDKSKTTQLQGTDKSNVQQHLYDGTQRYDSTYNEGYKTGIHRILVMPQGTSYRFLSMYGFHDAHTNRLPSEMIRSGQYRFDHSEQDKNYGTVSCFSYQHEGLPAKVWLAPERDGLIVRDEYEEEKNTLKFEISDMQQWKGAWAPKQVTQLIYKDGSLSTKIDIGFDEIRLNELREEDFVYNFMPGYEFVDAATNVSWHIGPHNEKIYDDRTVVKHRTTMELGWLYMASVTTLLVLTMRAYVRWKQNQWAKQV